MDKATVLTPLFLIHACGGELRQLTRLQKMCYFVDQETTAVSFDWEDTKWGPHSKELDAMLESFEERGHIIRIIDERGRLSGTTSHNFALADSGEELVRANWELGKYGSLRDTISAVASDYGDVPINTVLLAARKDTDIYQPPSYS